MAGGDEAWWAGEGSGDAPDPSPAASATPAWWASPEASTPPSAPGAAPAPPVAPPQPVTPHPPAPPTTPAPPQPVAAPPPVAPAPPASPVPARRGGGGVRRVLDGVCVAVTGVGVAAAAVIGHGGTVLLLTGLALVAYGGWILLGRRYLNPVVVYVTAPLLVVALLTGELAGASGYQLPWP